MHSPFRFALPLCMALTLLACDPLRERPEHPAPEVPPPFSVTLQTTGTICREGQVTLSASFEGGTPTQVVLYKGETELQVLSAPYQYTIDCTIHEQGEFSFMVRARAGPQQADSAPVSVRVDFSPPRIIEWRPKGFPAKDQPVEIVFSEPIDPGSLAAAPITLRDGNGFSVAYRATLSEDGKVLRFVPSSPLSPPVTLYAELAQENITDRVGHPLWFLDSSSNRGGTFNYWRFVPQASAPDLGGGEFKFAMRPWQDDVGFAAFVEWGTDNDDHLVVARWTGSAWERLPPPRVEVKGVSQRPTYVELEVDGANRPVLAWVEQSSSKVYVKRFDGTAWQSVGVPLRTYLSMRMRLGPEGTPVLLLDEVADPLRVVRWDGTEWMELGGPRSGNSSLNLRAYAAGFAADNDSVVVAWLETPETERAPRVYVSEYRDGVWTQFGEPFSGSGLPDHRVQAVSVALDASHTPHVAWSEDLGYYEDGVIYYSAWRPFERWSPPELIQPRASLPDFSPPQIVVDSTGEPWVAWHRQGGPSASRFIYYRRHSSSGWDPEQLVSGGWLGDFDVTARGFPLVGLMGGPILQPQ